MSSQPEFRYRLLVLGASTGGLRALETLLRGLPADFPLPLLAVQHLPAGVESGMADLLDARSAIRVKEADDLEPLVPGVLCLAPPDYHLLVERAGTLALATDPPVNFARPSVDVLFESAALAFGPGVIGVLLTGAGGDGGLGLKRIQEQGGFTIVQDPAEAECAAMPGAALAAFRPDQVLPLLEISGLVSKLAYTPMTDCDPDHA